jgi:hypothetical protein
MKPKLSKRDVPRVPKTGTPQWAAWRKTISDGMRRAKSRQRAKGLRSLIEVAVLYELPKRFVVRAADLGELRVIKAGMRPYVRTEEAEKTFGKRRVVA